MPINTSQSPKKQISGLPQQNDYSHYRDIHMDTARGLPPSSAGLADIHMLTAKGLTISDDIRMDTAKGGTGTIRQAGLPLKDREILESSEVKRKATVAQLCESFYGSHRYSCSHGQTAVIID